MNTPLFNLETTCLVVGGGPAGYGAALAAREQGCRRVMLVERQGYLGGMGASAGLSCYLNHRGAGEDLSDGIYRSLLGKLREHGAVYHDDYSQADFFEPEWCKWSMEQSLLSTGVEILYHCLFEKIVRLDDGHWKASFLCKGARIEITTDYVIDSTGDADVCTSAGVVVTHGRRSDGKAQPMTMVVQLGGFEPKVWAASGGRLVDADHAMEGDCFATEIAEARAAGEWTIPRTNIAMFWSMPVDPTRVTINGTRINGFSACNPLEVTRAEIEGRRQAQEIVRFFRTRIPGFAKSYLLQTGPQIGVRESRRISGRAVLTESDVRAGLRPATSVVACSYPIDVHVPDGSGTQFETVSADHVYGIPWPCLLPIGADNMAAAGRCISATHEAAGSFRVMPTCMGLGEAAGTAVALAAANHAPLHLVEAQAIRAVMDQRIRKLDMRSSVPASV